MPVMIIHSTEKNIKVKQNSNLILGFALEMEYQHLLLFMWYWSCLTIQHLVFQKKYEDKNLLRGQFLIFIFLLLHVSMGLTKLSISRSSINFLLFGSKLFYLINLTLHFTNVRHMVSLLIHFIYCNMTAIEGISIAVYHYTTILLSIFMILYIRSLQLIYNLLQVCTLKPHKYYPPAPIPWLLLFTLSLFFLTDFLFLQRFKFLHISSNIIQHLFFLSD